MKLIELLENIPIGTMNLFSLFGILISVVSLILTIAAYNNTQKIKTQLVIKKVAKNNFSLLLRHKGTIDGMVAAMKKETKINEREIRTAFIDIVTSLSECEALFDSSIRKKYKLLTDYYNDLKCGKYTDSNDILEVLIKSQKALATIIEYIKVQQ